jgi:chaperone LolA
MKRVLIGLIILAAGTTVVLSARKGLREHASVAPTVATVETGARAAEPEESSTVTGSMAEPGSADQEPVGTMEPDPDVGAGRAREGAPAPSNSVAPGGKGPAPKDGRRSAEGIERTDRGPTHPAEPLPALTVTEDSEVAAVLRKTAAVYSGARSLQADFSQRSMNPILRTTVTGSGTLYQRRPDRFLMRFSDPAGDLIVSDGTYLWLYYPSVDRKQVIRVPSSTGAGGMDLQAQFVGDPLERFSATLTGREEIGGKSIYQIALKPREPVGYKLLVIWVDGEDHLIRRFEMTEENGIVRHFELSNLRLNHSLSDELFRFTPPEDAHIVDRG